MGGFARIFGAGTYSELIWALLVVAVMHVVLTRGRWGIYTVAVGGNRHGAAEAGIKVRGVVIRNFVLCAVLAGFVGVLEADRAGTVTPDTAGAAETMFRAVSAAVIGGTLLDRRRGHGHRRAVRRPVPRRPARRPDVLQGVSADYLDFILGIAILVAMCINVYVGRVRKGSGHG